MDVFGKSKEGKEDEEEKRLMWVPQCRLFSNYRGNVARDNANGGALIGQGQLRCMWRGDAESRWSAQGNKLMGRGVAGSKSCQSPMACGLDVVGRSKQKATESRINKQRKKERLVGTAFCFC